MAKTDAERLAILIEANTKSYERAMRRIEEKTDRAMKTASKSVKNLDRNMEKLSARVANFAKSAGPIYLIYKIAKTFKDVSIGSVEAVSSVEEMESKFRTVFGNMAGSVDKWARDQAAAVNRSEYALKGYLAELQDTLVPLGFARSEAADLSKTLVKLGVDLASFNNKADAEVIRNLTSAIIGNHEAVRSYGISITEATMKQEILRRGFKGAAADASEMQKAQARLAIILRSTTDAQGDAARTSDSFANKVKGLDAAWERLKVTIGGYLSGVGIEVVDGLTSMANAADSAIKPLTELQKAVRELNQIEERLKETRTAGGPNMLAGEGISPRDRRDLEARKNTLAGKIDAIELTKYYEEWDRALGAAYSTERDLHVAQVERVRVVVDGLTEELRLSKLTNVEKRIAAALARANVTADSEEGRRIAALVRKLELQKASTAETKNQKAETAQLAALEKLAAENQRVFAERLKEVQRTAQHFGGEALSAFDQVIMGSKSASEALADLAHSFAYAAAQSALLGTGPLASVFGTSKSGGLVGALIGGAIGGTVSPLPATGAPVDLRPSSIIPKRAGGGPVADGMPYLVGEKGPELFVPKMNGSIVPNNRMSGSGSPVVIHMHNDFRGVSAVDEARLRLQLNQNKREAVAASVQAVRAERSANPGYLK